MNNANVIVFGEALVDAFADGPVPGGAPFNVACHLAALGLSPLMITRLGDDDAGAALRSAASRSGLVLDLVQHDACTAQVMVHEDGGGHVFEIPADQAFDRIDAAQASAAVRALGEGEHWLYFGTLALRSTTSRAALAAVREVRPQRVFVDLNWREAGPPPDVILDLLHDITVLKLSDGELAQLLDWLALPPVPGLPDAGDRKPAMAALCARTGARHVLVTHGADGAALWDTQGSCVGRAAAPPVSQMIDTVGAGDAFSAMMLAGLISGHSIGCLMGQAVAFASLSCGWRGALPPDHALYAAWRTTLASARPTGGGSAP